MSFHFFAVPALDPEAEQDRLNDFCQSHRVVAVDRQFIAAGAASHWAICIQIAQGPGPLPEALRLRADRHAPSDGSRRNPVDWKQELNEADFQVFAPLRSLRKALAESAGVPVFAVFSNEQLAAIVQTRPASRRSTTACCGSCWPTGSRARSTWRCGTASSTPAG